MGNFWLRFKVWTKVTLIVLVAIYLLVFVTKNSERKVQPWIFYNQEPTTSVLTLSLFCLLVGVVGTLLVRTTLRTVRQVRELREKGRVIKTQRELSEMKAKAARLQSKADPTAPTSASSLPPEPLQEDRLA